MYWYMFIHKNVQSSKILNSTTTCIYFKRLSFKHDNGSGCTNPSLPMCHESNLKFHQHNDSKLTQI